MSAGATWAAPDGVNATAAMHAAATGGTPATSSRAAAASAAMMAAATTIGAATTADVTLWREERNREDRSR
jgi:hypothetical protein